MFFSSLIKRVFSTFLLLSFLLIIPGCSVQKMAIRATSGLLDAGFTALLAEDDLPLARSAIESDLKLLEGMALADPDNEEVFLLLAQGFTSYALAFVEDESPRRAKKLYERSCKYANQWLKIKFDLDLLAINNLQEFQANLNTLSEKSVPGIFWLANSWAQYLNLSLDEVSSIVDFPRVESLMTYVLEHDEAYYYAGAHLFFGAYYGGKSAMLGGDPEKAKKHFVRHRELTGGNFILGDLFEVKFLVLRSMDEEKARASLNKILDYDLDQYPEIRLINRVAQEKARVILENLEDYL